MKCQELDLDSVLPDQEMLMKLMIHPLQIQVCIQALKSFEFNFLVKWFFFILFLRFHIVIIAKMFEKLFFKLECFYHIIVWYFLFCEIYNELKFLQKFFSPYYREVFNKLQHCFESQETQKVSSFGAISILLKPRCLR